LREEWRKFDSFLDCGKWTESQKKNFQSILGKVWRTFTVKQSANWKAQSFIEQDDDRVWLTKRGIDVRQQCVCRVSAGKGKNLENQKNIKYT